MMMGYSRQQLYEIRRDFQTYSADGLIDRPPNRSRNRTLRKPAKPP
jgi:hypothetical protein